jgi:two-component system, cell cycle response regulator
MTNNTETEKRPRVLCVDDEPNVLQSLRNILRKEFETVSASSAYEALDIISGDQDFVAVISDMRMPGMDGGALLARLRYEAPHIIRILLTGHADLATALSAVNQGYIFRFLVKPCRSEELITTLRDAAEHHELLASDKSDLQDLVFKDHLTNLFNRRYFDMVLPREHARCKRYGREYSIAFVDLDGVKAINTQHGHLMGSRIIQGAGSLIAANTRRSNLSFRFGGDEFVSILVETSKENAHQHAQRLCSRISAEHFEFDGVALRITASAGVASYPGDDEEPEGLLKKADAAMYAAKGQGKNTVVSYHSDFELP